MDLTKENPMALENIKEGAVLELFNEELQKVISNIQDPNTNPTQKRDIIIKLTFKPDEDRFTSTIGISVDSKLAGNRAYNTRCVMEADRNGEINVREIIPRQQELFQSDNSGKGNVTPLERRHES